MNLVCKCVEIKKIKSGNLFSFSFLGRAGTFFFKKHVPTPRGWRKRKSVRQPIRGQRLRRLLRGHGAASGKPMSGSQSEVSGYGSYSAAIKMSQSNRRQLRVLRVGGQQQLAQLLVSLSTSINHLRVLIVILALTSKFLQREKGEGPRGQHLGVIWKPMRFSDVQKSPHKLQFVTGLFRVQH